MRSNTIPALHKARWVRINVPVADNYENILCREAIPVANEIVKQKYATEFVFRREAEDTLALYFHTTPHHSESFIKPFVREKLSAHNFVYQDFCILYFGSGNEADLAGMLLPYTSTIISGLMSEAGEEWSTETAIEKALPMHIALVHSFGLSRRDISLFYQYLIREGLANLNLEEVPRPDEWRSGFLEMLESNFLTQRDALTTYVDHLISCLRNNEEFEESWMNGWKAKCEAVSSIFDLQTDTQRRLPEHFRIDMEIGVDEYIQKKWPMLMELTRFINGQMGMELFFEFNVFHIISRCAFLLESENSECTINEVLFV